jgi:transposase InsO family protein
VPEAARRYGFMLGDYRKWTDEFMRGGIEALKVNRKDVDSDIAARCGADAGVTVRSDNGLVFASRLYRRLLRSYGLQQEFIHPHTPEQNGVVEAYHKTFKRECVWQHGFATIDDATTVIAAWIDRYNNERPHSSLGYLTPADWRDRDALRLTTLTIVHNGTYDGPLVHIGLTGKLALAPS